jgi:hypothetical protein
MNKKIIGLLILFIIALGGFSISSLYTTNNINNTNNTSQLIGEQNTINGLKCKIPDTYLGGSLNTSTPGIQTYGTYKTDQIYITVYSPDNNGNKVYQGDVDYFINGIGNTDVNQAKENKTINGHNIQYISQHSNTRGDYRLAFFQVGEKKVLIEWLGSSITPDIENIINSFYQLN